MTSARGRKTIASRQSDTFGDLIAPTGQARQDEVDQGLSVARPANTGAEFIGRRTCTLDFGKGVYVPEHATIDVVATARAFVFLDKKWTIMQKTLACVSVAR